MSGFLSKGCSQVTTSGCGGDSSASSPQVTLAEATEIVDIAARLTEILKKMWKAGQFVQRDANGELAQTRRRTCSEEGYSEELVAEENGGKKGIMAGA